MIVEPSAVFFETGEIASFSKADGSITTPTRGFLEAAATERPSGDTTRTVNHWHLNVPFADEETGFEASDFGEGDTVIHDGIEYTILDLVADDGTAATFLLDDPTL